MVITNHLQQQFLMDWLSLAYCKKKQFRPCILSFPLKLCVHGLSQCQRHMPQLHMQYLLFVKYEQCAMYVFVSSSGHSFVSGCELIIFSFSKKNTRILIFCKWLCINHIFIISKYCQLQYGNNNNKLQSAPYNLQQSIYMIPTTQ